MVSYGNTTRTKAAAPTQPAYSKSGYKPPVKTTANERMAETGTSQIRPPVAPKPTPAPTPTWSPQQKAAATQNARNRMGKNTGSTNTTQVTAFPQASLMSFDGGGGGAMAPAVNPDTDYLQEAGYLATVSALDEALQNFNTQDTAERGRYDLDYKKGLGDLGYKDENIDDDVAGTWDWNDMLTASGRGYQNNTNDFASRGMLQSQGYLDSLKMLERSLDDQRGAMGTARQGFQNERNAAATNYKTQDTAARNTAKVDAITRLQQSLGLV